MSKYRRQNILLVEIMIAVLFFARCSGVMLETFMAAREYDDRSQLETEALVVMQNITERIYAADSAEEVLEESGFSPAGDVWTLEADGLAYELTVSYAQTDAGTMRSTLIRAIRGGEIIAEIPGARYLPGGDAR